MCSSSTSALALTLTWACGLRAQGPLTFAATGTADAASFLALIHRARWAVGDFGVQLTYVKHSPGGDAHIGRILSLLNPQSEQFAVLLPHFCYVDVTDDTVQRAVDEVFGTDVPENMKPVLPYLLANLVYHKDFLAANLPANHPLWSSGFCRIDADELLRDVSLNNRGDKVLLQAMGVPLEVRLLERVRKFETEIVERILALAEDTRDTREGIRDLAQLIPTSELNMQSWSAGRERAEQWGSHLVELIEPTIEKALRKLLPQGGGASSASGAGAADAAAGAAQDRCEWRLVLPCVRCGLGACFSFCFRAARRRSPRSRGPTGARVLCRPRFVLHGACLWRPRGARGGLAREWGQRRCA